MTNEIENNKKTLCEYLERIIKKNKLLNKESNLNKEYCLRLILNDIDAEQLEYEINEISYLTDFIMENFEEFEFSFNEILKSCYSFNVVLNSMDVSVILIKKIKEIEKLKRDNDLLISFENEGLFRFIERVIIF